MSDDKPTLEEAQARGYIGERRDPAPNSAYTLEGVANNEPTPENDHDMREQLRQADLDARHGQ